MFFVGVVLLNLNLKKNIVINFTPFLNEILAERNIFFSYCIHLQIDVSLQYLILHISRLRQLFKSLNIWRSSSRYFWSDSSKHSRKHLVTTQLKNHKTMIRKWVKDKKVHSPGPAFPPNIPWHLRISINFKINIKYDPSNQ